MNRFGFWGTILDPQADPNEIIRILINERARTGWYPEREHNAYNLSHRYWIWWWRKGPWAKECRQLLEAGKGKGTDSTIEPPQEMEENKWDKPLSLWSFITTAVGSMGREQTCPFFRGRLHFYLFSKAICCMGILEKTVGHKDTQCLCCQEKQKHCRGFWWVFHWGHNTVGHVV